MQGTEESLDAEMAFLENSTAWFDDVLDAGSPMIAPPYPNRMVVCPKETAIVRALDRRTGEVNDSVEIIYATPDENEAPLRAYLVEAEFRRERKLGLLHVWKRCRWVLPSTHSEHDVEWEIENERVMVECVVWGDQVSPLLQPVEFAHQTRDSRNAILALQYVKDQIGTNHENLRGILDVLQDDTQWWIFCPFVATEDLFSLVQNSIFNETTARFWFRQVLTAVVKLHKAGICHQDLGLESVLIQDDKDTAVLSDFEFACLIPFDKTLPGDVMRRLIKKDKICGKPRNIAPEIWKRTRSFDAFAVDIWALGIMLYVMLVGSEPWGIARQDDERYANMILQGKLEESLNETNLSPSAKGLLMRILQENPRDRITLYELRHHPWVLNT